MPRPVRIAHISDLHITTSGVFEEDAWEAGVRYVNDLDVDAVVASGDITDWGLRAEWEIAVERLKAIRHPLLTCLGNHDSHREGWRFYEQMLERPRYYVERVGDVDVIVLDSSQPDLHDGEVGREQRAWLCDQLAEARFPMVVLHHHLIPIPNTGREMNICRDAGGVLKVLDEFDVPLVIGGHRHMPWAWELNGSLFAHAGTFSSNKRQMPHSLNLLEVGPERTKVELVKSHTGERTVIADVTPPATWGGRGEEHVHQVLEGGLDREPRARDRDAAEAHRAR